MVPPSTTYCISPRVDASLLLRRRRRGWAKFPGEASQVCLTLGCEIKRLFSMPIKFDAPIIPGQRNCTRFLKLFLGTCSFFFPSLELVTFQHVDASLSKLDDGGLYDHTMELPHNNDRRFTMAVKCLMTLRYGGRSLFFFFFLLRPAADATWQKKARRRKEKEKMQDDTLGNERIGEYGVAHGVLIQGKTRVKRSKIRSGKWHFFFIFSQIDLTYTSTRPLLHESVLSPLSPAKKCNTRV